MLSADLSLDGFTLINIVFRALQTDGLSSLHGRFEGELLLQTRQAQRPDLEQRLSEQVGAGNSMI